MARRRVPIISPENQTPALSGSSHPGYADRRPGPPAWVPRPDVGTLGRVLETTITCATRTRSAPIADGNFAGSAAAISEFTFSGATPGGEL